MPSHLDRPEFCARPAEHRSAPRRPAPPVPLKGHDDGMPGPARNPNTPPQYSSETALPATRAPIQHRTQLNVARALSEVTTKRVDTHSSAVRFAATNVAGVDTTAYRGTRVAAAERDSAVVEMTVEKPASTIGSPAFSIRRVQYERRKSLRGEVRRDLASVGAMGRSEFDVHKRILEGRAIVARCELADAEPPHSDRRGNALARAQKADPMYIGAKVEDEGIPAKYFEGTQATSPKITEQNCAELVAEFESAAAEAQAENDRDVLAWMDEMIAQTTDQESAQTTGYAPWFSGEYYVPDGARKLAPEEQFEAAFLSGPDVGDEARA